MYDLYLYYSVVFSYTSEAYRRIVLREKEEQDNIIYRENISLIYKFIQKLKKRQKLSDLSANLHKENHYKQQKLTDNNHQIIC